jgi:TPR repeat protein
LLAINKQIICLTLKGALSTLFVLFSLNCFASQNNLEKKYGEGFYLSQLGKNKQAFEIMLDLANKNYAPAKHNVALSYKYGLGVKKDLNQAFYWLKQAHNAGVLHATVELANFYYNQGNIAKARELWQIGAKNNDEYALFNLAMLALENKDKTKAYNYLIQAQQYNHPQAELYLQQMEKL